jgi:hypothetical protein
MQPTNFNFFTSKINNYCLKDYHIVSQHEINHCNLAILISIFPHEPSKEPSKEIYLAQLLAGLMPF